MNVESNSPEGYVVVGSLEPGSSFWYGGEAWIRSEGDKCFRPRDGILCIFDNCALVRPDPSLTIVSKNKLVQPEGKKVWVSRDTKNTSEGGAKHLVFFWHFPPTRNPDGNFVSPNRDPLAALCVDGCKEYLDLALEPGESRQVIILQRPCL